MTRTDQAIITPAGIFLSRRDFLRLKDPNAPVSSFGNVGETIGLPSLLGLPVFLLPARPLTFRRHPFNKRVTVKRVTVKVR